MVAIIVSRAWAQGGRIEFDGVAGLLSDVIRQFADAQPDYRRRLLDESGEPYGYLNLFVDDELVPRDRHATLEVRPGSTITIVPPLMGG